MTTKKKKTRWDILKNPWICFASIAFGIFLGQMWKNLGVQLAVPGEIYLSLLKMSVIPIISTAIIGGLAGMLRGGLAGQYMKKMILIFVLTVFLGSAIGMLAGFIGKPGINLGKASEAFLGKALLAETAKTSEESAGLWAIVTQMVPANVFNAFSSGKVLSVIFVSVMVGAAIGMFKNKSSERLLDIIQAANQAFVKILGWILYGLPFGLACMMGGLVATLGIDAILALGKFVIVFYIAGLLLCAIYFMIIKLSTKQTSLKIISAIRDPLFVSFSAASCIAPLPIALQNMEKELKQPREVMNFTIPLAVTINRHSYAMLFSLTAIFLAQIFGKTLDLSQCLMVFVTSALVGTAAAGRLVAAAPMLVYILAPIGVPLSVGITIFLTVGAILDPMVQMTILFGGCANATVIAKSAQPQHVVGQYLMDKGYIDATQLKQALDKQADMDKIGQILVDQGHITKKQLNEALSNS